MVSAGKQGMVKLGSPRLGLAMDRLPRHAAQAQDNALLLRVACPSLGLV